MVEGYTAQGNRNRLNTILNELLTASENTIALLKERHLSSIGWQGEVLNVCVHYENATKRLREELKEFHK